MVKVKGQKKYLYNTGVEQDQYFMNKLHYIQEKCILQEFSANENHLIHTYKLENGNIYKYCFDYKNNIPYSLEKVNKM